MSETKIPCYVCKKLTRISSKKVIGTLCSKHKTDENFTVLSNTSKDVLLQFIKDNLVIEKQLKKVKINKYGEIIWNDNIQK